MSLIHFVSNKLQYSPLSNNTSRADINAIKGIIYPLSPFNPLQDTKLSLPPISIFLYPYTNILHYYTCKLKLYKKMDFFSIVN